MPSTCRRLSAAVTALLTVGRVDRSTASTFDLPPSSEALGEALAAQVERRVADLLVDAERVLHAGLAIRSPPPMPASNSVWPTWVSDAELL